MLPSLERGGECEAEGVRLRFILGGGFGAKAAVRPRADQNALASLRLQMTPKAPSTRLLHLIHMSPTVHTVSFHEFYSCGHIDEYLPHIYRHSLLAQLLHCIMQCT
jgi:hypothetical protein